MFGIDDAIMAAAIPAVMDLAGGFMTNQQSASNVAAANQFSAAQSDKQMQFQKEMRATQYQTAVEDMKNAGLNPMLAYSQGGAGNLAGAAATGQAAPVINPVKGVTQSAIGAANLEADLKQKDAQTTESVSRTTVNETQAKLLDAQTAKVIEEIPNISADTKNKLITNLLIQSQKGLTSAQEAQVRQNIAIQKPEEMKAKTSWGEISPYLKDIATGVNSATKASQTIRGR